MIIGPSVALAASILVILALIRLKRDTGLTIFAGATILFLLSLSASDFPGVLLSTALDSDTLKLLIIIAFALTLSSLMELGGMLSKLATAMESINPKMALHLIPAAIGLVPMPAGALVSAAASKDLATRTGLNREQKTFINYWFRHIWEFSMPVYPSIVLLSVILSVSVADITLALIPVTVMAVITGAFISWRILRNKKTVAGNSSENIILDILKVSWPIFMLVISILLGVEPFIAFPAVVLLVLISGRHKLSAILPSFKYGFHPKIMFLIFAVMFYQAVILESGAVSSVFLDMNALGLPPLVILAGLPFIIAMATGISMAFTGIAFPLLAPFIITNGVLDNTALILAYTCGMLGMLLSPVHLCLVMSIEYFKAQFNKVYRYLVPLAVFLLLIVVILYLLFGL